VDTEHDGDHSVEVLVRQAFKVKDSKPQGECLDAETLAAWVDGGLRPDECRIAESHVADCSRCQAMAAALVRTTPTTPATAPEVSWLRSWNLRWLVPLTAAAAAVAIWFALPDERRRDLTVLDQSRPEVAVSAPRPSEQREAASDERLLQPRSAVAEPGQAQSDRRATVAPRTEPPNGPKAAEAARAKGQRERTELAAGQDKGAVSEEKQTVAALKKETDSLAKIAPPPAPSATTADSVATQSASVPSKATQSAAAQSAASSAGTQAPAGPPLPAAKPAASSELGAATSRPNANAAEPTGTTGRRDQATAGARIAGGSLSGGTAREIQSPDRSVRWRIVGRGLIQRSSDAGATWESLQIESTTELTAGSAPTPFVCWLVGRAGAVLLSSDGRRFVRLPYPTPTDLVAVQATDARSAIVTEAGGRTYRTTDGGTTWEPSR